MGIRRVGKSRKTLCLVGCPAHPYYVAEQETLSSQESDFICKGRGQGSARTLITSSMRNDLPTRFIIFQNMSSIFAPNISISPREAAATASSPTVFPHCFCIFISHMQAISLHLYREECNLYQVGHCNMYLENKQREQKVSSQ